MHKTCMKYGNIQSELHEENTVCIFISDAIMC